MLDKLDAALRFQQEALNLRASVRKCWQQTSPMPIPPVIRRAISILPVNLKSHATGRDATSVVALDDDLNATHPGAGADASYRRTAIPYSGPASLDGNTVDMDRERTQFADNSLQYQMSQLSGQIKGMMNVLRAEINGWHR